MVVKERKRKIDKAKCLKMLEGGYTVNEIAEEFGCSGAAVRLFMKKQIEKGSLEPKHNGGQPVMDTQQFLNMVIEAFEAKSKLPIIEEDNKRLRVANSLLDTELKGANKKLKEYEENDRRFKQAQQQGIINKPLTRGGSIVPAGEDILGRTITTTVALLPLIKYNINVILNIIAPRWYYSFIPIGEEVTQWRNH